MGQGIICIASTRTAAQKPNSLFQGANCQIKIGKYLFLRNKLYVVATFVRVCTLLNMFIIEKKIVLSDSYSGTNYSGAKRFETHRDENCVQ